MRRRRTGSLNNRSRDQALKQNASLVEEAAAAAAAMHDEAQGPARAVSVFRIDGGQAFAAARRAPEAALLPRLA